MPVVSKAPEDASLFVYAQVKRWIIKAPRAFDVDISP